MEPIFFSVKRGRILSLCIAVFSAILALISTSSGEFWLKFIVAHFFCGFFSEGLLYAYMQHCIIRDYPEKEETLEDLKEFKYRLYYVRFSIRMIQDLFPDEDEYREQLIKEMNQAQSFITLWVIVPAVILLVLYFFL